MAEREWKSAAKHGQRRAAQQNELSRFQQEIRSIATKIVDLERRSEEKKLSTIELKKEFDRVRPFYVFKHFNAILLDQIRYR